MEGIKDIIEALEGALAQLKALAPEEPSEEESDETEEAPAGPPEKSEEDDGFAKKRPLMVAMLKRSIK